MRGATAPVSRAAALFGLFAAGCHLVAPYAASTVPTPDAGRDGSSAADVYEQRDADQLIGDGPAADAALPGTCAEWSDFGVPVKATLGNLQLNHDADDDWGVTMTPDEDLVVVGSLRPGGLGAQDLWLSYRDNATMEYTELVNAGAVNSREMDGFPCLSPDGRTLVFNSLRSAPSWAFWVSLRAQAAQSFPAPAQIARLAAYPAVGCSFSSDGLHFYYAAFNGNHTDIYRVTRSSADDDLTAASPGTLLPSVNDPAWDDVQPSISSDGRELFFASNRPSPGRIERTFNLWVTRRPDTAALFTAPTPVNELNSAGDDSGPFITADGTRLYFVPDTVFTTGGGQGDIYVASRACLE